MRSGILAITVFEQDDMSFDGAQTACDESAQRIDEVVRQLNTVCRGSSIEFALRVGAIVIHNFYGGDTEAWRKRGPKATSFRRLATHPDLAVSAGALYRCVAVFELCDRLNAPARWRRLGASHLRAVIGVSEEQQEYLLARANAEHWSVQTLQAEAQCLRGSRSRGGRRTQSTLGKHIRALDRCLKDCCGALDGDWSHAVDELNQGVQLLAKTRVRVDELAYALEVQLTRMSRAVG
jgi:hypothetical protein